MAARVTNQSIVDGPASRLMDVAIELAIRGGSPFPDRASFLNHDAPQLAEAIAEAFDEDMAVVLVWPDGSSRVLRPGDQIPAPTRSAALKASGSGIDLPAA